ncbi:leucine-rich repeat domain-containing protein [Gimesia fumaroli]|uniref:Leucine Rich repeats (2 copies) n=1 Tax=Gimesia fumaroli TaxID=2527976 RepID=A0A518IDU3_9PLAN|nr:hypothetical protein [Gimesia fumaroli]QDV51249.1 Leucine Rich repeats (2 copies) [Gimesia fumaroli]
MFLLNKYRSQMVLFLSLLLATGCGEPPRTVTDETAAYWVLSKQGSVTVFLDGRSKHVKKIDQLPAEHFSIRSIQLVKKDNLQPAELKEISGLKQLRNLNLSRTNVDHRAILNLTNLPQLRALDLSETNVSDAGLEAIGEFAKLKTLDLSKTKIDGSGLGGLDGCGKLTELNLSGTDLRPDHLNMLKGFTNLIKLNVLNTYVNDQDIGDLKQALKYCEIITKADPETAKKK